MRQARVRSWTVSETATVLRLPNGRELSFGEYGAPEGLPVMAFHGTPGLRLQLAPADGAARAVGVRLIAPDRPGYGHSDYVRDRRLIDWPADVDAIAQHLGIDHFGVLGVSGGGPYALACATAMPERLTSVTLVSSPSPFSSPEARLAMTPTARRGMPLAHFRPLVRVGTACLVQGMRHLPRAVELVERVSLSAPDRRVMTEHQDEMIDEMRHTSFGSGRAAAQDISLFVRDWGFRLEDVKVPVAVWHGESDRISRPFHARVLAAGLPDATLHLCPGEGHLLFANHAARILASLDGAAPAGPSVRNAPA